MTVQIIIVEEIISYEACNEATHNQLSIMSSE